MQSLEIAVFEAANPGAFAAMQAELHRSLALLFDGYVGSLGLRSVPESNVYADVVLWESETAAKAAADAVGKTEELAWFPPEIAEIRFFDHLVPARDAGAALSAIGAAPVVEIVLVKPAVNGFVAAHEALHGELAAADVVVEELRLKPNGNGIAGDVNGWATQEAIAEMGPQMMAKPELAQAFDQQNEMLLFMPFTTNFAS